MGKSLYIYLIDNQIKIVDLVTKTPLKTLKIANNQNIPKLYRKYQEVLNKCIMEDFKGFMTQNSKFLVVWENKHLMILGMILAHLYDIQETTKSKIKKTIIEVQITQGD